jgi:hypothetical protein
MKDWMMPLTILCIGGAILGIGAIVGTSVVSKNPFEAKNLFDRDMEKPILWVFYDTSIPNARKYNDFGSRSSRALNLPFLNLCYESIVKHNKAQYRIEVVDGLTGLADKLGGWDKLPAKYQNPLVTLEPADLCWIRQLCCPSMVVSGLLLQQSVWHPLATCLRSLSSLERIQMNPLPEQPEQLFLTFR